MSEWACKHGRIVGLCMLCENERLHAEAERLRATVETLCVTCNQLADQQAMPDNFWVQSVTAARAAIAKAEGE